MVTRRQRTHFRDVDVDLRTAITFDSDSDEGIANTTKDHRDKLHHCCHQSPCPAKTYNNDHKRLKIDHNPTTTTADDAPEDSPPTTGPDHVVEDSLPPWLPQLQAIIARFEQQLRLDDAATDYDFADEIDEDESFEEEPDDNDESLKQELDSNDREDSGFKASGLAEDSLPPTGQEYEQENIARCKADIEHIVKERKRMASEHFHTDSAERVFTSQHAATMTSISGEEFVWLLLPGTPAHIQARLGRKKLSLEDLLELPECTDEALSKHGVYISIVDTELDDGTIQVSIYIGSGTGHDGVGGRFFSYNKWREDADAGIRRPSVTGNYMNVALAPDSKKMHLRLIATCDQDKVARHVVQELEAIMMDQTRSVEHDYFHELFYTTAMNQAYMRPCHLDCVSEMHTSSSA